MKTHGKKLRIFPRVVVRIFVRIFILRGLKGRDIFYPYPVSSKLSYRKVLLDSFIWYRGISKGILVTFFNIAHASLSQTIIKLNCKCKEEY